jgi:hypothetical protein
MTMTKERKPTKDEIGGIVAGYERIGEAVKEAARAVQRNQLAELIREHLGSPPAGAYQRSHIDLRLDRDHAAFVNGLYHGLNAQDVRLASGKHVGSVNDAVRWLIEQCCKATK